MKENNNHSGAEALRESTFVKEAAVGMHFSAECSVCHDVREVKYMHYTPEGWVCIDCMRGVTVCEAAV